MTKSEMFKKAHEIARNTVVIVGNYMIAFSVALKEVYKNQKGDSKMKVVRIQTIGLGSKFNTKMALEMAEKEGATHVLHSTLGMFNWLYTVEGVKQLRASRMSNKAPKPTEEPVKVLTASELDNSEILLKKNQELVLREFGKETLITREMIEFSREVYAS